MRVATFNLENLDEGGNPSLEKRIEILKPHLLRLDADILCLQEIHGQEEAGKPRGLNALKKLISGTPYETYSMVYTKTGSKEAYDKRNLVILSRYKVLESYQLKNRYVDNLKYRRITAIPYEKDPVKVRWERPALYAKLDHGLGPIHMITLHLKSRIPSFIPGQPEGYGYKTVTGWAEGYFLSSMKRVGQALEVRFMVDELLDRDKNARIIVCGDFNAEPGEVPIEAITGRVENTKNPALGFRQLISCSKSMPKEACYTHIHEGNENLLDHMVISQALIPYYQCSQIHNEVLHDESIAYATDKKYPESDHAPFIASFNL